MRLKTQRTVIYVAMGLTMAALVGGYAAANLAAGVTNSQQQGTHTTSISPVSGLDWSSTTLQMGGSLGSNSCATAGGCSVTSASVADCDGGVAASPTCGAGTWDENVTLNTVADTPFTGTVQITLYVTVGGTSFVGTTLNYTDASGNTQQSISLVFEVGTSTPGNVTAVTVVATVA
jgi:hypothetical protein